MLFANSNSYDFFVLSLSHSLRKKELLSLVCNQEISPIKIIKWQTNYFITKKLLKRGKIFEGEVFLKEQANKLIEKCKKYQIKIITFLDDGYPQSLKILYDPPLVLYYQGFLPDFPLANTKYLSVIGSRQTTSYIKDYTEKATEYFVDHGGIVISGLATGVDTAAHLGALNSMINPSKNDKELDSTGSTVAVLGCGLDYYYPPENRKLQKKIISAGGCVLTEYPLGIPPNRYTFPLRNRIIAGLSYTIFMVQAKKKSGALITVNYGLELGKEILTFRPYDKSDFFGGNYELIEQGAKNVRTLNEFADFFSQKKIQHLKNNPQNILNIKNISPKRKEYATSKLISGIPAENQSDTQEYISKIIELLQKKPMSLPSLANALKKNYLDILSYLLELQLQGSIKQLSNQHYYLIC